MHYYLYIYNDVGMRKKRAAEQLPAFLYDAKKINPFLCQNFITNFGKCHKNVTFKLTSCQTYGTI